MNVIARRLTRLNWIATVVIPVAVILMEVYWFYPWFLWLGKTELFSEPRAPFSIGGVIFLLGGGFVATRYLLSREWSLNRIRWGVILCSLVVVFTVVRSEYHAGYGLLDGGWFVYASGVLLDFSQAHALMVALPAGAYLWWRGIRYGRAPLYTTSVYRTFMVGIVSFVLLVIVWRVSMGEGSLEELATTVAPHVAAFFFFALVSLALINLQSIRQQMTPEDMGPSFNRRWLPILIAVIGGIVLIGIGIASIFSPEFVAFLSRLLGSIGDVVRTVIGFILVPFAFIAAGLYWVIELIINLIRSKNIPEFMGPDFEFEEEAAAEVTPGQPISEVIIVALKWILFAAVAIVIIYLLARAVSRFRASRARIDIEEVNESLWSWGSLMADVRLFLSAIWQRLWRRRKEATPTGTVPRRYLEEDETDTLDIRTIYRRMLRQASRFGMGRRDPETPYEYRGRLGQIAPDSHEPLAELTDLYVTVRYGETEPQQRQVSRANSLWQVLKRLLRPPARSQPQI
ncbi:MAG: DUF4129 domain-containing protein [Dehalococcoidales bacterium]|nr:MAG: DUF4129 domain-containing protein [Dehalococcoidales bacterium]